MTSSVLSGVGHSHSESHISLWLSEMLMKNLCSKLCQIRGTDLRPQPLMLKGDWYCKEMFMIMVNKNNNNDLLFLFDFSYFAIT